MDKRTIVKVEQWPVVRYLHGGAITGWCVWVRRTTYSDGTVVEVMESAEYK